MEKNQSNQVLLCEIRDHLEKLNNVFGDPEAYVEAGLSPVAVNFQVPQTIARENLQRKELWIFNESTSDLYIAPNVGGVDRDNYSLKIAPNDAIFLNEASYAAMYKKEIVGFWSTGAPTSSKAMVTEFFYVK